jgi:hypothetical protein
VTSRTPVASVVRVVVWVFEKLLFVTKEFYLAIYADNPHPTIETGDSEASNPSKNVASLKCLEMVPRADLNSSRPWQIGKVFRGSHSKQSFTELRQRKRISLCSI